MLNLRATFADFRARKCSRPLQFRFPNFWPKLVGAKIVKSGSLKNEACQKVGPSLSSRTDLITHSTWKVLCQDRTIFLSLSLSLTWQPDFGSTEHSSKAEGQLKSCTRLGPLKVALSTELQHRDKFQVIILECSKI